LGGCHVLVGLDRTLKILAFLAIGECEQGSGGRCWSELVEAEYGTPNQTSAVKKAAESLFCQRQRGAEFLLESLSP